jgi:hypothetical protein
LALYSWVILCILSRRPVTTASYAVEAQTYNRFGDTPLQALYAQNERYYRSARIIMSIVMVMTVPMISAVCARAAVVYVQNQRDAFGLHMRQVMALADRSWTDPALYLKLVSAPRGMKRYGSRLLFLAIILHILGCITYPLQTLFLSSKTIKTPTAPVHSITIPDLPEIGTTPPPGESSDDNTLVIALRRTLQTARVNQGGTQMWKPNQNDSFYAPLSTGFNSGFLQQFSPRINSSASYIGISEAEFPTGCDTIPGAFYVNYNYINSTGRDADVWRLIACMPADLLQSPWKATRIRQDFSEELYLNVTTVDPYHQDVPGVKLYKVTVNTTAGYFELPNYMNDGVAGPLINGDPGDLCGTDCLKEISRRNSNNINRRQNDAANSSTFSPASSLTFNKGPLFTTALALFGVGSFIDTWPQTFIAVNASLTSSGLSSISNGNVCLDVAPMAYLFAYPDDAECVLSWPPEDIFRDWLFYFNGPTTVSSNSVANAFGTAAFLANQAWLETNNDPFTAIGLYLEVDLGSDTQVPDISLAGIVVISILMGLYLLPLLGLAVYASTTPRWTERLDSFAMLRLGAAVGDRLLPLLVGKNSDKINILDEIPGSVRDISEPTAPIGQLALVAGGVRLRGLRRYQCYPGDDEIWTLLEKRQLQQEATART